MGRSRLAILATAAIAALFAAAGCTQNKIETCADVGIVTATSGPTPRAALSAYVQDRGGQAGEWRPAGETAFKRTSGSGEPALSMIFVREQSDGRWVAHGGCR